MTAPEPRDSATHPTTPTPTRSAVLGATEGQETAAGLVGWDYAVVNRAGDVIDMHVTACRDHSYAWLKAALMTGTFGRRAEPREQGCAYCVESA